MKSTVHHSSLRKDCGRPAPTEDPKPNRLGPVSCCGSGACSGIRIFYFTRANQKKYNDVSCKPKYVIARLEYQGSSATAIGTTKVIEHQKCRSISQSLLKGYQSHINVDWCNKNSSIKYLYDKASIAVVQKKDGDDTDDAVDEIKKYFDYRYLCACEASWRIFGYDVHYRCHSVFRLPFPLPG
ncbi:hypothetical protein LXL04_021146 [Taraxacum kok-saghyz]